MILNPSVFQLDTKLCHIQCFNSTFKSPCLAQICSARHYRSWSIPTQINHTAGEQMDKLAVRLNAIPKFSKGKQTEMMLEGL